VLRTDIPTVRRLVAVADRAFKRLVRAHGVGAAGLRVVPVRGAPSPRGVDLRTVTFNGLTIYLLNLAADAAARRQPIEPGLLPADQAGAFLDPAQSRLAAVRRGNVWYAVHGRRFSPDARNDFGLVALKLKRDGGSWQDLLRPRPRTKRGVETAGPVIHRGRRRLFPRGDAISIGRRGGVVVQGRFAAPGRGTLARSAVWRFAPLEDGARMTFRARAGDAVVLTTYLPAQGARTDGRSVWDSRSRVTTHPGPVRIRWRHRLASCCDKRLVAADMIVRPPRAGVVTYSVRANRAAVDGGQRDETGGGSWWPLLGAVAALGLLVLGARRRARRDRGVSA
jgi:hypothetical protein